ncbi:phage major tail protein, TP901-1 family [Listeria aquatica]|uniref:phage major tail protein, TP901-1 family n=1 Tax=Listeria aquatica TaxID=1494960 RepID=UPI003EF59754
MALEYQGSDKLYIVAIPGANETYMRPFNQTDGSTSIEADDIELETKDKTETGYGKIGQTISFGQIMTTGDPAYDYLKKAIRNKQYVSIIDLDKRTLKGEQGVYKLNSYEEDNSVGDNVSISVEASLSGTIKTVELSNLPDGAPENESDGGTVAVESVALSPKTLTGTSGTASNKQLSATLTPENADTELTYSVSPTTTGLTVDGTGKVSWTASVAAGTYTITAKATSDNTKKDTATLTLS